MEEYFYIAFEFLGGIVFTIITCVVLVVMFSNKLNGGK